MSRAHALDSAQAPWHGGRRGICTCSGASSALQGPNAGFSKLMNRLLGVHVDMQRKIFDYFTALQVDPAAELALSDDLLPLDVMASLLLICRI